MYADTFTNSIERNLKRTAGAFVIALTMLISEAPQDVAKTLQRSRDLILKGSSWQNSQISSKRAAKAF